MSSRLIAALCVSMLLCLAPGCSLFDPREPEEPEEIENPPLLPTSPSAVMYNLDLALDARAFPIYMACCDTSFVFVADPADVIEWGEEGPGMYMFQDWDYDVEESTISNLFASVQGDSLPSESLLVASFYPVAGYPDPPAPIDSAVIWRDYSIVVSGSVFADWGNPAAGRAKITMLEDDSSYWYISRWEDYRLEASPDGVATWGLLKASNR